MGSSGSFAPFSPLSPSPPRPFCISGSETIPMVLFFLRPWGPLKFFLCSIKICSNRLASRPFRRGLLDLFSQPVRHRAALPPRAQKSLSSSDFFSKFMERRRRHQLLVRTRSCNITPPPWLASVCGLWRVKIFTFSMSNGRRHASHLRHLPASN